MLNDNNSRIVLHIDFDYFYAQCEEIRNPELRIKPVCVCVYSDRGNDSGAIATANYNARKYGIKSGMSIHAAKSKLAKNNDATFLPTDFDYYSDISEKAMNIIQRYANIFEYVGRDEAYLDITKKAKSDYTIASHVAQQIKNSLYKKIKLGCSVGISPNKLVSKIASDYRKPDGLTVVMPKNIKSFLEPLMVRDIPGIGKKTEQALVQLEIKTIGQLRTMNVFVLNQKFGRKIGTYIYNAARGINDEPVTEREPSIQFSKISTLKYDSKEFDFLHENLRQICKELYHIIEKNNKLFKMVGIQFIQSDLTGKTRSKMLKNPTSSINDLEKVATILLKEVLKDQQKNIRRLGVKVSELSDIQGQSNIDMYF